MHGRRNCQSENAGRRYTRARAVLPPTPRAQVWHAGGGNLKRRMGVGGGTRQVYDMSVLTLMRHEVDGTKRQNIVAAGMVT